MSEIDSIISSARLSFNSDEFLGVLKAMYSKYYQIYEYAKSDEDVAKERMGSVPLCGNNLIVDILALVTAVAEASARRSTAGDMMDVLNDIISEAEPGWIPDLG
jgi:hypothetical protein